jgi:hypothetical protein
LANGIEVDILIMRSMGQPAPGAMGVDRDRVDWVSIGVFLVTA